MNRKEVVTYLKENELDIQRAHAFLFICDLAYGAYANSNTVHKVNFSPIFCYLGYDNYEPHYQFISKDNIDKIGLKIWNDYLKNPKSLDQKIKNHQKIIDKFENIWKGISNKKIEDFSNNEIVDLYKQLTETAFKWWQYASFGEEKGHVIETVIVPRFAKRHKMEIESAREIVHELAHPEKKSVFSKEREAFFEIVIEYSNNREIKNKINNYSYNYYWIKTDFCRTTIINQETVLKDIKNELKKHSLEEIEKELKNLKSSGKVHLKKYKDLKLSSEDKRDLYFASKVIYWIDQRKKGMLEHLHYLWNFFEAICRKFDIDYEYLNMCTVVEIENFIRTGKRIEEKEIRSRRKGVFLDFERKKKPVVFFGKDAKEILKAATEIKNRDLKGMVASKGMEQKIIGRAKVVMNTKKDFFKNGEILVTSMTRPEWVPLMRIAKAIITDEGGIACHAAIVSREMGKPCIIGTKTATQLIKDGDLVELDVNKGTVKVVK